MKQNQVRLTLASITVQHREPEALAGGKFSIAFWLRLKVNSPMGEGGGTSPSTVVTIRKPSIEMARIAAHVIEEEAQRRIQGKELGEVLASFSSLIRDLSSQEP